MIAHGAGEIARVHLGACVCQVLSDQCLVRIVAGVGRLRRALRCGTLAGRFDGCHRGGAGGLLYRTTANVTAQINRITTASAGPQENLALGRRRPAIASTGTRRRAAGSILALDRPAAFTTVC